MSKPNVIFLSIDRLHAGYLGAYGNTWIETPNFDALAAGSMVFDRATIDSPQLALLYRSLWQGVHVLRPLEVGGERHSIPAKFGDAGWQTKLVTDDSAIASLPGGLDFAETIYLSAMISPAGNSNGVAEDVEQTQAALFFAEAINRLEACRPPFFLWLHTASAGTNLGRAARISPSNMRMRMTQNRRLGVIRPIEFLAENFDPDELLAITHAYAGQVSLIDQLLGSLIAVIAERGLNENTILVCFSPRGFPLGEHHRVGPCDDALYSELTHVPLLVRGPARDILAWPHSGVGTTGGYRGVDSRLSVDWKMWDRQTPARRLAGIRSIVYAAFAR